MKENANHKLKLLVIFGGQSSEYAISCISAASILKHIDKDKYGILKMGITEDGRWFLTDAAADEIGEGKWINSKTNEAAFLCPDRSVGGIQTKEGKNIKIDCILPILHGQYGEDGAIQGLFELSGIPYVGSGVLASSCAMDKAVTKTLVEPSGIRQARCYFTNRYTFSEHPREELEAIRIFFNGEFPLFVKPANAGSSVGITMVKDKKELFEGIKLAASVDHKVLIEEAIKGREVEVAVLGNRSPHASPVGEIMAAGEFYDYKSKYEDAASVAEVAEGISKEDTRKLQEAAVRIYRILDCRGLARVDFFLTEEGIVFNELNSLPGFTKISMYPKLWKEAGVGYSQLIDKLIDLALEEE